MQRLVITAIAALAILIAAYGTTLAHAKLDHCTPDVGSALTTPPNNVRCWFTEEIDDKQSTLSVTDASGSRVDNSDGKVDLTDPDHKQMFTTLKPLATGLYKVNWHVVTPDDQGVSEGSWYFGVGAVTVPTAAPSGTETRTAGASSSASANSPAATAASSQLALAQVTATIPPGSTAQPTSSIPSPAVAPTFQGTPATPETTPASSGIPLVVFGGIIEAVVVIGVLYTLYRQTP